MTSLLLCLSFVGGIATVLHPAMSLALRVCHWWLAGLRRAFPGQLFPDPPASFHWMRARLNWLTPVTVLPEAFLNATYQREAGKFDHGWGWEEWGMITVVMGLWLLVQCWQDNRDCTCGDDRHRRKARKASRVEVSAGRLVVVPEPA